MQPRLLIVILLLVCALAGCTTTGSGTIALAPVREFAAMSGKLDVFAEVSVRYRDTYQRERPYLAPAAAQEAAASNAMRRAAYPEFISIARCVQLYMDTLGTLAGEKQGDLSGRLKSLVGAIKAQPDSHITVREASAYTRLAQLMAGALSAAYQQASATQMLRQGAEPMQALLTALSNIVSDYTRTASNEKKTVLGLYEVELPFLETSGPTRLLLTLANLDYALKQDDYSAASRQLTLAGKNLHTIAAAHLGLVQHLRSEMINRENRHERQ